MSCRAALLFSLVASPVSAVRGERHEESHVLAVQAGGTTMENVHEQMWGARPMSLVETTSNETAVKLEIVETNGHLQINDFLLYSKGGNPQSPCVVFFPGDLSDLEASMLRPNQQLQNALPTLLGRVPYTKQLAKEWSLEGIHHAIAARFPNFDVVTIRGQLQGIQRSYPRLTGNPNAGGDLNSILDQIVPSRRLLLVGFSRGGEALSGLINSPATSPANRPFWMRVDGINFVDCGGSAFNIQGHSFFALRQVQPHIQLSVEWTGYPGTMAAASQRSNMISSAAQAGISASQNAAQSLTTFSDHMNFLKSFGR